MVVKHDDDRPQNEPKAKKPTPQQMGEALHTALKGMVAEAEAAGQRDMPHVQAAKAALAMAEPDEEK